MHADGLLVQAFVYLVAAVAVVPVAKRLGLGSVLGYLVAGAIIGPAVLGWVGDSADVMHFAEFGVVMMLFLIGLELRPALLWSMRGPILGLGGLQVAVTTVVIAGIGLSVGLDARQALAIGMILALSSTAIVLQSLAEKGLQNTPAGQASFAVLLFQDIAVIPMLALLPLLAVAAPTADAGAHGAAEGFTGWQHALLVCGVVAAIVAGGRFAVRPAFRFIADARLREVFTAAALLLVVGIALAMQAIGLSAALGTFLAGVVLADNEYRHELEADIEPFKGLLLGLFFLSVGASIDFAMVAERPGTIAALVAALVAVKLALLIALGRFSGRTWSQTLLFAAALAQGGEFAFVLFSVAGQHGVLGADISGPLIAAVALSMAMTPLLLLANDRWVQPRFASSADARPADVIDEHDNPVILAGFGRFGQIVGRLLKANGERMTVLDLDPNLIDVLRKFGHKVFYGDASRLELLQAAGAAQARLLVVAVDDREKANEIVAVAQRHFPKLRIMARAVGRHHGYELLAKGVQVVERETLGSSLELGVEALCALGHRRNRAFRSARAFRCREEAAMRELHSVWGDDKVYFARAKARADELQSLLQGDLDRGTDADSGWDPPGTRVDAGS